MANNLGDLAMADFVTSPETADFLAKINDITGEYVIKHPYLRKGRELTNGFTIWHAPKEEINNIIDELGASNIDAIPIVLGLLSQQDMESAGITQVHRQPYLDLRGQGVLLGFVDTGIDYTQECFIYEDGTTKIKYIWDQTLTGNAPEGFDLGAEYDENEINEALCAENPYEIVPHKDTVGHGTFLASVAGGRDPENIGAAPDSEIIVVKLRKAKQFYLDTFKIPKEQENAYESSDLMLGVDYILEKAQELNRPVAICISVGSNIGGHDGFNMLEEYLTKVSSQRGVCICAAAGDESNAEHHMMGKLEKAGDVKTIQVKMVDKMEGIMISIWNEASDRISISIGTPTGELIGRIPAKSGAIYETKLVLEKSIINVRYFFPMQGSGGQQTVIRITDPTPGIWDINVHGDIVLDGTFHSWLPLTGFVNPEVEFLIPSPNYTTTIPGTAQGVITCGAYSSLTKSLYASSSWGPSRIQSQMPTLAAPGVNVGGTFPTGYGLMSGTSVAAAITAGASALMLGWGIVEGNEISMNTYLVKAFMIRGCERDPGLTYPNNQWGYGRLNLMNTFQLLRG